MYGFWQVHITFCVGSTDVEDSAPLFHSMIIYYTLLTTSASACCTNTMTCESSWIVIWIVCTRIRITRIVTWILARSCVTGTFQVWRQFSHHSIMLYFTYLTTSATPCCTNTMTHGSSWVVCWTACTRIQTEYSTSHTTHRCDCGVRNGSCFPCLPSILAAAR